MASLTGELTGRSWSLESAKSTPVDPYFVWFDWTTSRADARVAPSMRIAFIVEVAVDPRTDRAGYLTCMRLLAEAGFLTRVRRGSHLSWPRFLTGNVSVGRLKSFFDAFVAHGERLLRWEVSVARYVPAPDNRFESDLEAMVSALVTMGAVLPAKPVLSMQALDPSAQHPHAGPPQDGPPLVVVIDDFCNFAAEHVRPKLKSIWHQDLVPEVLGSQRPSQRALVAPKPLIWTYQSPGEEADGEHAETYGAVMDVETAACRFTRADDEMSAYHDAGTPELGVPPRWSHGSAVMYLLCRSGSEVAHARRRTSDDALIGTDPDGALCTPPPRNVEFVQLPDPTVLDTSGGSLGAFALDGIHRAVRNASHGPHSHVIVNMSFGTHGGPHDGSSMFERAMLELLDIYDGNQRPELHIVLPAGNSHLWQAHGSRVLSAQQREATFDWHVLPDGETDSFLELWFESTEGIHVTATAPDGSTLSACVGQAHALEDTSSASGSTPATRRAALIFPKASPNAVRGGMALLAVGPTRRTAQRTHPKRLLVQRVGDEPRGLERRPVEAPAGLWRVKVRNTGNEFISVHAWVQRADAAPGRPRSEAGFRGRQSYLMEGGETPPDPRFTLNGIATATHAGGRLHVVGAMDSHGHMARYSAAGPNRDHGERMGPSAVTVVGDSRNREGRFTGGVLSGSAVRLSGTSMAAAVYSRLLHDQLRSNRPMQWPIHDMDPDARVAQGEPEHAHPYLRGMGDRLRHRDDLP